MERKINLCAQIPESLYNQVRTDREANGQTIAQYIETVLTEHFMKGGETMEKARTLAFQVSEELFNRVKVYLAKNPGASQKQFIVGLIEKALDDAEMCDTAGAALSTSEDDTPA